MNVLIQNSQWRSAPVSKIGNFSPLRNLGNKLAWSNAQKDLTETLTKEFNNIATNIIAMLK
jgi:hypothetical protein